MFTSIFRAVLQDCSVRALLSGADRKTDSILAVFGVYVFNSGSHFAIISLMSEIKNLAEHIYSRFGAVKRARGCFLYTEKGVRLTDMYQEGGRAILGWGGNGAFTVFKNVLERGITGRFCTPFSLNNGTKRSQLSRAVSELFSGSRTALVFSTKAAALNVAVRISAESTCFYRPWNPQDRAWAGIDCIVFAPPLPWGDELYILAVKDDCPGAEILKRAENSFDGERFVPPPLCAAVVRSIYDLKKAVPSREEKDWFIYDTVFSRYWTRNGPYLFPTVPESSYTAFVLHCLDCRLVISPTYHEPSIVPFGADKGNFSLLKKNCFEVK